MISNTPREGDIFDIVVVGGHQFTIRYGYYEEAERGVTDPIPIYPCFLRDPHYTSQGNPLVTRVQDACEHYTPANGSQGDGWCADCTHCQSDHQEICVCHCEHRRKPLSQALAI